jgi:hypothetical protein
MEIDGNKTIRFAAGRNQEGLQLQLETQGKGYVEKITIGIRLLKHWWRSIAGGIWIV